MFERLKEIEDRLKALETRLKALEEETELAINTTAERLDAVENKAEGLRRNHLTY